nr:MAG TPA: hypothetical protein [Caudoviricetes sp.]
MDFVKLIIYLNDGVVQVNISEEMSRNLSTAVKDKSEDKLREYFHNLEDTLSGKKIDIELDDLKGFEFKLGK